MVGDKTNCPSSGISYPVKSGATTTVATATRTGTTSTSRATTTTTTTTKGATTTTSSGSTPTGSSVSGTGYWYAYYNSNEDGCLISGGTWYTSGTCATYHATASGTFGILFLGIFFLALPPSKR